MRKRNDSVAGDAPLKHSAPCCISQDPQRDAEAVSKERGEIEDPFAAKYHHIVRQSARDSRHYSIERPKNPPGG
jgi:hypothetical protein